MTKTRLLRKIDDMATRSPSSSIPELLFSGGDNTAAQQLSRWRREGRLRSLYRGVYTSHLAGDDADIVRRHWSAIVSHLVPGAVLSHRSAFDTMPHEGELFLTRASGGRELSLPGLTIKAVVQSRRGPLLDVERPGAADIPYQRFYVASQARAYLENLTADRRLASRQLPRQALEERLERLLALRGPQAVNTLRDDAREVAQRLGLAAEFKALDALVGALLGTRPARVLSSRQALARAHGLPFDPQRIELFEKLAAQLRAFPFADLAEPAREGRDRTMFAFVESYFSNYIEGTTFTVEEAQDIVFNGRIIPNRDEDSHDIKGTFDAALRDPYYSQPPATAEAFLTTLRGLNEQVMGARRDKQPGAWKTQANQAGSTLFVLPELVPETLRQAWRLMALLDHPMQRALFTMFVVSETHPFTDGNGRTARLLMNALLSERGQCRIIVPTLFREDYLLALKALTHQGDATAYIRAMRLAQQWTRELRYDVDVPGIFQQLMDSHSLREDPRLFRLLSPATGLPMSLR